MSSAEILVVFLFHEPWHSSTFNEFGLLMQEVSTIHVELSVVATTTSKQNALRVYDVEEDTAANQVTTGIQATDLPEER